MNRENEKFLSLYKTYEGLLRGRGTDYRTIEDTQNSDRMRMMRQMRNYLCHSEDPDFLIISPACIKILEKMVKEEAMKGDLVKNHLRTPAKSSVKEGTLLSAVIYRIVREGISEGYRMPVYDADTKRLKGVISLEKLAYELNRQGNILLEEKTCGPYEKIMHLLKPEDPAPEETEDEFYCCTKDGTLKSQYMGCLDR